MGWLSAAASSFRCLQRTIRSASSNGSLANRETFACVRAARPEPCLSYRPLLACLTARGTVVDVAPGCVAFGLVSCARGSAKIVQHAASEELYEAFNMAEQMAGGGAADGGVKTDSLAEAALDKLAAAPVKPEDDELDLYGDIAGGNGGGGAVKRPIDDAKAEDETKRAKTEGALLALALALARLGHAPYEDTSY